MSQSEPTAEEMAHTLRSEAAKVRRWLKKSVRHFEARQYAGFDMHDEAQVRRRLDMTASCFAMLADTLEEYGHQGNAGENPRAQSGHRRGRGR